MKISRTMKMFMFIALLVNIIVTLHFARGAPGGGEIYLKNVFTQEHALHGYAVACPTADQHSIEAYATLRAKLDLNYAWCLIATSPLYAAAAVPLLYSIARTGSRFDRVVCVTPDIGEADRARLQYYATVVEIEKINAAWPIAIEAYRDTLTKLRVWQLVQWRKLLYIDIDTLVLQNMDELFDLPEWSTTMDGDSGRLASGFMIVEPSLKTFDCMQQQLAEIKDPLVYPDLTFLNDFFGGRANLIPRWYQVYQQQLYQPTFLADGGIVTLADARVKGMHFPGEDKPWDDVKFPTAERKYSKVACIGYREWARHLKVDHDAVWGVWYSFFVQARHQHLRDRAIRRAPRAPQQVEKINDLAMRVRKDKYRPSFDQGRTLIAGNTLMMNAYLKSVPEGRLWATVLPSGSLALYSNADPVQDNIVWETGPRRLASAPFRLVMRDDNNLVLYDSRDTELWYSDTGKKGVGKATLRLEDGGVLRVTDEANATLWASSVNPAMIPRSKLQQLCRA